MKHKKTNTSLVKELQENNTSPFNSKNDGINTVRLIFDFVNRYSDKSSNISDKKWLQTMLQEYKDYFNGPEDIENTANAIVESFKHSNKTKKEFQEHLESGKSTNSFIQKSIDIGATSTSVVNIVKYNENIDSAIAKANLDQLSAITTEAGTYNQNPSFHGFIAEQHHTHSFNLDAAQKGKNHHAECLKSNDRNSVDIVIKDGQSNSITQKYQLKYGGTPDKTISGFKKGDYRGQRKLVPSEQTKNIPNSTDKIKFDGIESQPLSYKKAKEIQKAIQQRKEIKVYEWSDMSKWKIAKSIGKSAFTSAGIGAMFQGGRIMGARLWNTLTGNENKPISEDLALWFTSSLGTAVNVGTASAITGGVVVAAKRGWIKVLRDTPAGKIANMVYMGLENAKILFKLFRGEISPLEALDYMGYTTTVVLCSIVSTTAGAEIGAAIGTVFGPIGTTIGGLIGAIAGGMAGSEIGSAIYQAGKSLANMAVSTVCATISFGTKVLSTATSMVGSALSGVASLFGF